LILQAKSRAHKLTEKAYFSGQSSLCEAQAQQIEQGKDDFGGPGRIGRMLQYCQLRFIAQDGIEDIGRIPGRGGPP
jgi:hypothetical protein